MSITIGFGFSIDVATGVSRKWYLDEYGVKRWTDTGMPFTHYKGCHWENITDDEQARLVRHGAECGAEKATYGSADWFGVDCPDCLAKMPPNL